ncbi:hypothetical protein GCM10010266_36870 [Streptomyces griseomycini]|nr:hypothetical protein GCM10010266_36870 [Streptomyces griseomycini]
MGNILNNQDVWGGVDTRTLPTEGDRKRSPRHRFLSWAPLPPGIFALGPAPAPASHRLRRQRLRTQVTGFDTHLYV